MIEAAALRGATDRPRRFGAAAGGSAGLQALGQHGGEDGAHAGGVEAAQVAEQGVLVGLEAVAGELEGGERHAQLAAVEQQEGLF